MAGALAVDPASGLNAGEIAERRRRAGPNRFERAAGVDWPRLLASQFTAFVVVVLIAAAIVSAMFGDLVDAIAILVIIMLNGAIGFVQEYRAEQALRALGHLVTPHCHVRRNGQVQHLPTWQIVPGDVVALEAGDRVPADLRLIETVQLAADESTLTGESVSVDKRADRVLDRDAIVAERSNIAFSGTLISAGRGAGIAVATGMATELGRIAALMRARARPPTPLQRRLAAFGKRLSVGIIVICAVIFAAGLAQGEPALLMFLTAVSLAVAAVPEALPAVVTVTLALGAQRMAARQALIRRLPAVEALGSVTFICADKTGTLTQNRMRAERFYADGREYAELPAAAVADGPWRELGRAMALNTSATFRPDAEPIGEPTETALLAAAASAGHAPHRLAQAHRRIGEVPFDARHRIMVTWHESDGRIVAYVKGAPEAVLELCAGDDRQASDARSILAQAGRMASEGYRVLAFARADSNREAALLGDHRSLLNGRLLGLVALRDPPRPEAADAVRAARTAGITPVMLTGDHPDTARAIAIQLGILDDDGRVVTGQEIAAAGAIDAFARSARVYARVSPEQKIDIVNALQAAGEIVAMTGDGVNDAPALKRADIGIAMGRRGTEVAREAADMVLLDDNFATIIAAIREGRRIYDNIRKFVSYTMTSNAGEVWTISLAPLFGLPLPLLPIQILWINLVTDGLPGLAFCFEPEEPEAVTRPPRPPQQSILAGGIWQHMLWIGLLIGGLSLLAQHWAYRGGHDSWQTVVFTTLTLAQLVHALTSRSERRSLFNMRPFSNPFLMFAIAMTVLLQLAVIYVPALQAVFHTVSLTAGELAVCGALACVVLPIVELEKWAARRGWIYRR